MSTQVFPSFAGLGWDVTRTPIWDTSITPNQSGKEVRMSNYTYPRWQWDLVYTAFRQGVVHNVAYTEFAQIAGFYNARQGSFDSFLYTDADDNAVTAQALGTGDGVTTTFPLIRAFGGFVEPVLAPNVVTAVKINGTTKTLGTDYTVSAWGSANPGIITFTTAPAGSAAITADFSYYWPCRFLDDNIPFNKWISNMYAGQKVSLMSLKN